MPSALLADVLYVARNLRNPAIRRGKLTCIGRIRRIQCDFKGMICSLCLSKLWLATPRPHHYFRRESLERFTRVLRDLQSQSSPTRLAMSGFGDGAVHTILPDRSRSSHVIDVPIDLSGPSSSHGPDRQTALIQQPWSGSEVEYLTSQHKPLQNTFENVSPLRFDWQTRS